jgi:hypothetical protein
VYLVAEKLKNYTMQMIYGDSSIYYYYYYYYYKGLFTYTVLFRDCLN